MAEKKPSKTSLSDDVKLEKVESPLDFLSRTGVTSDIKEVISLVIENRPEIPISFIADYFDSLANPGTALMKAQQKLLLAHHSRPAFQNNLNIAYNILRQKKSNHGLRGLTGKTHNDLLTLLCRDLTGAEFEPLFKKIVCSNHEVVSFHVFKLGVLASFLYQDFLKGAESLYNELDLSDRGKADKQLCEAVLNILQEAVTKTTEDPLSVIQTGCMLSSRRLDKVMAEVTGFYTEDELEKLRYSNPDSLLYDNQLSTYQKFKEKQALLKSGGAYQTMGVDEFIVSAAEIFLEQVFGSRLEIAPPVASAVCISYLIH